MAKICSTEPTTDRQPKCLNIFENDDWIIPTNIWSNIISTVKSIEDIPDYLNTYKLSCKNEYISQKQYLFSIVLYLLKNNLDWKFIDRCRDESQHNIYDKIKEIINRKSNDVFLDSPEILKYREIKNLFSISYPSSTQVNIFFNKLVDKKVFNDIFYKHLAYVEPFLGLDWYCEEAGPPPIWQIRYNSRKRKSRTAG